MKRVGVSIIISLLSALVTGCGGSGSGKPMTPQTSWTMVPTKIAMKSYVADRFWGNYVPDEGYTWLAITLSVRNNTHADKCLSWLTDKLELLGSDSNRYGLRLVYNTPVNQLPQCYGPEQTKTGDVFFEVPVDLNVRSGRLVFQPQGESAVTITLTNVPLESDFLDPATQAAVDSVLNAYAAGVASNDAGAVAAIVSDPVVYNGTTMSRSQYQASVEQILSRYVYSEYSITDRIYHLNTDGSVRVQGRRNYRYHDNVTGFDGSGSVGFIAILKRYGNTWLIAELVLN